MEKITEQKFTEERSLFQSDSLDIADCMFFDGESPLKESKNIKISNTTFAWKYPLWYCQEVIAMDIILHETARSGIWYTDNIKISNSVIDAPKTFRRATNISLTNVSLTNAEETLWTCKDIEMCDVTVKGNYFGKDSENIYINNMELSGDYAFDGGKNIEIHNSKLISKDAFWNCENVVVKDSLIIGEYLGWNSKHLSFENCFFQSEQGFCYIEDLVIKNSKLINTNLAFEYSTVDIESLTEIDSIKNPIGGKITAKAIGKTILDDATIDKNNLIINLGMGDKNEE